MTPHLELQHLHLQLNQQSVLRDISLSVQAGEHVALIGPSGAGKTSLLRVLATEYRTEPAVLIHGQNPWMLSAAKRQTLRSQIGMVWQKPPLPPSQSVITAIQVGRLGQRSLWRALRAWWQHDDHEAIHELMQQLGIADKALQRCGELSGGQLQRVGIARVLYQSPSLVLADEPVSALDPVLAENTLQLMVQQARAHHATVVCSLHAVELALRFFPRIVGLREGQIVFDTTPDTIDKALLRELYAGDNTVIEAA